MSDKCSASFDPRAFRRALGNFATGVTVVTAADAERGTGMPAEERQRIAEAVGIGAVKYADLAQNRTTDYVFSFDKMLELKGNTAAYMQYAVARVDDPIDLDYRFDGSPARCFWVQKSAATGPSIFLEAAPYETGPWIAFAEI